MIDIGKALKEERIAKGITLEEVSRATLIMPNYLEQIENDDFPRYDGYIAVYIKKYAEFLNLNGEELLNAYKDFFRGKEQIPRPKIKKGRTFIVLILILLAVGSGFLLRAYFINKNKEATINNPSQNEITEEPQIPTETTEEPSNEPEIPAETQPEKPIEGIQIVLKSKGLCWMGITIDGDYYQKYIHNGETIELKGKEYIKIRFGNAPVVTVNFNGKDLGIVDPVNYVVEKTYKP
jgi:cytoskeletal protein RodZ